MDYRLLTKILLFILLIGGNTGGLHLALAQTVTPASNGTNISADNFATGTWRTLTGPVISETAPGQLTSGNIRLNAPSGFVWDTGGTAPAVTVSQPKGNRITVTFSSRTSSQVVFSVSGNSSGQPPNNPHTLTFSNLRIRPAQGTLASGQIRNVGSASPGGTTNYGALSMTAGADNKIRVEDAPASGGSVVGSRSIKAGHSITVYSNVRDQFNNFKRNESSSWTMQNITGGIVQGDIAPAGDNRSAVFTGTLVGTGNIRASSGGLTTVQSGLVTVNPTGPNEMVIQTEPGSPATAGQQFSPQPVIAVLDQYGNIVDDSNIEINAERFSGEGTLQGTKTVTVSNGIAEFQNLSHNIEDTISIRFLASGLPSVISQDLIINPASANSLIFLNDVPNGSPDTDLSPPFEIQVIDEFGNHVAEDNISINLHVESQDGDYETITVGTSGAISNTDNNGVASFGSFQLDEAGSYTIKAVSSGNNLESPESNLFTIASAGELAGFEVEISGGGTNQIAGQEFDISIRAVDGNGDLLDGNGVTEFTGKVNLTTTGIFSADTDTLDIGPFSGGVYDPHPVTLTRSGEVRIRAVNADTNESQSGSSNLFTLEPASANLDSSFLASETATLIADGTSETEITLQLVDEFGNYLIDDISDDVEIILISNNGGEISSTAGNGDGTYTATLTASDNVGQEEIGASIDGNLITSGNLFIDYTFDELDSFLVEASGGGIIGAQTAGQAFSIRITALDEYNNIVGSFDGNTSTAEVSSNQTLSSGNGTTSGFTNGVLSNHSITVTSAGNTTITARSSGSFETGASNEFTVEPAAADPAASIITSGRNYLRNNGTDNTQITVQLKDEFNNNLLDGSNTVTLSTTAGTLSSVTNHQNGTYSATLTGGTAIETATVTGLVNGLTITDDAKILISDFNQWTAGAGGQPSNASDWSNTGNWSLGSLPTTNQITLIPAAINGNPITRFPVLSEANNSVVNPTLDFLVIEEGANITLSNRTITVNQEISGGGSFFGNNGTINIGGNVDLRNFIAGSSDIYFNGSSTQTVNGDFTGNNLFIENDVTVHGFFEAFSSVNISEDKTLILDSGSQFVAIGDIYNDGLLIGNESDFTISGNINGSDITLTGTRLTLNGENPQLINGIRNIKSFIINNPTTITIENDLVITDTLDITQGQLTVKSGLNLATNVTTGLTSNIRMLREIEDLESGPGWRLLSTPLQATYQNFLSETITQGFENSSLGFTDSEGDSLQPNVMYYDETYAGTDNQRWRAPSDAENNMNTGRGYFVYFFGDIAGDDRYNQAFPYMLEVDGAENTGNGSEVILPVTYTAEADTGWNIVGNPYAATVDWDDGTWQKNNMSNAIYVWDENTNQYLTWNGVTGSLGNGKIAPFQGFWVKANGNGTPDLRVRKSSKTTGGIFRKSSSKKEDQEWPVIELNAEGSGMKHSTFFSFTEKGRNNIDDLDAYRLLPFDTNSFLEIFTLLNDGTELAIHSLPRKFGKSIELPVHISGLKNGSYLNENITLTWPQMKNIPEAWTITLTDTQNGNKINLKTDHFYDFTLNSRAKTSSVVNTPQNFSLVNRSKIKAQTARFFITINPGADGEGIPEEAILGQNYPNPFNPATTIRFGIPLEGNVKIDVYDVIGRRVQTLTDQRYEAGYHQVEFHGRSLASGVYFYRLITQDKVLNKRMTLIK